MHARFTSRSLRILCSAALIGSALFMPTSSDALTLTQAKTAQGQALQDGKLYAIDIKCRAVGDLQSAVGGSLFSHRTRTHLISVSKTSVGSDGKLPTDTLAIVPIYSGGYESGNIVRVFENRACTKSFLVAGGQSLYIVASVNEADDFTNSIFGTLLTNAFDLVTPLFTLFLGVPPHHSVTDLITNVKSTSNPLINILNVLNAGRNYSVQKNVRIGSYSYTTELSVVDVNVREVPSVVRDANTAFLNDFRSQINTATQTLVLDDTSCRKASAAIAQASFTAREDIAYALIVMGAKAGGTKQQVISCLGWDYAPAVLTLPASVLNIVPVGIRFNENDMADVLPSKDVLAQPAFSAIRRDLDDMVVALSQYGRNSPRPEAAMNRLKQLISDNSKIVDKSSNVSIGDSEAGGDVRTLVNRFIDKRYIRFGCYAATNAAMDQDLDGAPAILLIFNAGAQDSKADFNNALAVRLLYARDQETKRNKVTTMIISDNRAYVTAVLNARGWDCNGFSVDKPKATPPTT